MIVAITLTVSMQFFIPLEVGRDSQFDAEGGPGDGLDMRDEVELGELVNVLVDGFAQFGDPDKLSDFVGAEVVEPLEGEALLLDLLHDVHGDLLKLSQRAHGLPHPAVDHLAQRQRLVRQLGPAVDQDDLVDGPNQTASGLRDEDHVGHQGEAFEFQLRDVSLKEDVDFGRGLFDGLLDGDGHAFHEFLQLQLLFFSHAEVLELS